MKGLVRFLKGYKLACFGVVVFMFVQVAAALLVPTLVAGIVNDGIVPGDVNHVWALGLAMLGAAAVSAAATLAGTYVSASIATGVSRDMACALYEKAHRMPHLEVGRFGVASLITRSTSDVNQIQQALLVFIEMLLPVPFMVVIGMALMFSKDPVLAAGIVGVMIAIVVAFLVLSRVVIPYFERLQRQLDTMNLTVRESIAGVRIVRAFRRTGWDRLRMEVAAGDYAATAIKTNRIFAVVVPFVMLLFNATTFAILFVGGNQVAEGSLEIGDIMALVEYAMLVLGYLLMGVAMLIFIPQAQVSARRINEVLESEALPLGDDGASKKSPLGEGGENGKLPLGKGGASEDAADEQRARNCAAIAGQQALGQPVVEFRGVGFSYEGAENPVLKDVSFVVNPGETTAIIGATGSGKSTIANLLMGFFEARQGDILVDGKPLGSYHATDLRKRIGFVPQKPFLFKGTIADNLRHGLACATERQMRSALATAQIADFVEGLEDGLDSPVTQGGDNFSGGQRQRLAIARALVRRPEILLFDDSFSALDATTDFRLRRALKEDAPNSAKIVIAQRVSSIADAERVVVLDEGRVVGTGTHDELLNTCTEYRTIVQSQEG